MPSYTIKKYQNHSKKDETGKYAQGRRHFRKHCKEYKDWKCEMQIDETEIKKEADHCGNGEVLYLWLCWWLYEFTPVIKWRWILPTHSLFHDKFLVMTPCYNYEI